MSVLHTPFCTAFGVRYPIVQTGMGWVSGARLTAATANAGGLGFLASATMTVAELERAIDEVKSRTEAPFGVNMRADHHDIDGVVKLLPPEKASKTLKVGEFTRARIVGTQGHDLVAQPI